MSSSKKKITLWSFIVAISCLIQTSNLNAQFTISPFQIQSSKLYEKLEKFESENPKASIEDTIKKANQLLNLEGLNFIFTLDKKTCEKIKKFKSDKKNKNKPVNLRTTLQSTDQEKATVLLPNVKFGISDCSECYLEMPILEVTNNTFITKIRGLNIKFNLIPNFSINFVAIVENRNVNKITKFWLVPNRMQPLAISNDFTILYFDLQNEKYKDIALAMFDSGVFQFYKKTDLDLRLNGKLMTKSTKQVGLLAVGENKNKKILRFSKPCI